MHGRQPNSRQVDTWWDSLQVVWQDKSLGPAQKLAYSWLWWHIGGRPGKLTVTTGLLGAACGSGHEAACRWLSKLDDAGLIEIVDRDTRKGVVHLYVNDPRQEIRTRPVTPDPQGEFEFANRDANSDSESGGADAATIRLSSEPSAVTKYGQTVTPGVTEYGQTVTPGVTEYGQTVTPNLHPIPAGETPRTHARTRRPTDRPTGRPVILVSDGSSIDLSTLDWAGAHRLAMGAVRWIPVKRKAAYEDARLLLFAAVLASVELPESCFRNAVDAVKTKRPRNAAAYFRRCLAEEVARHYGQAESDGPRILRQIERAIVIPDEQVKALLDRLRETKQQATPDEKRSAVPRPGEKPSDGATPPGGYQRWADWARATKIGQVPEDSP